jgi:solute carrier family 25 phosphate transporter 3
MLSTDGVLGFYAGLAPILFKQIPYTMAKFAVQGNVADMMYAASGKGPAESSSSKKMGISLSSGVIAGIAAAVISHPADTLLSKVRRGGGACGGGGGGPALRMDARLLHVLL